MDEKDTQMKAPAKILAADIGGTHSRFGHFEVGIGSQLVCKTTKWLRTREATSFMHLVDLLNASDFSLPPSRSDVAVFSIAGPVTKGTFSRPPNIAWDVDLNVFQQRYPIDASLLINDFEAQAFACRSPIIEAAQQIVSGNVNRAAPLVVIGAGTGLGQAALMPSGGDRFKAIPSESGHSSFPFESDTEFALMQFLLKETGEPYVRTETILSGSGLSRVHHFLSGQKRKPAEVANDLGEDSETLRWMARFFGRVCRNAALQVLAFGGVYIAGGVAAKIPRLVTHPEFLQAFRHSVTMGHVLDEIPVFLNANEESGLWGAAYRGVQILTQSRLFQAAQT